MELDGRVALITGSTSGGMGRSTAITLALNGADIVLNYGTNRRDAVADERAQAVDNEFRAGVREDGQEHISLRGTGRGGPLASCRWLRRDPRGCR